jgi:hypothetical protein
MRLTEGRWIGNGWPTIEIDPVDDALFLPMLAHLATQYEFDLPPVIDKISGFGANFSVMGSMATLDIDTYDFSIAFEDEAARDYVLADLLKNPPNLA